MGGRGPRAGGGAGGDRVSSQAHGTQSACRADLSQPQGGSGPGQGGSREQSGGVSSVTRAPAALLGEAAVNLRSHPGLRGGREARPPGSPARPMRRAPQRAPALPANPQIY